MPEWFGRNLDAWSDTIHAGGVSDVIDGHEVLRVHVDQQGLFSGYRRDGQALAGIFGGQQTILVIHDLTVRNQPA